MVLLRSSFSSLIYHTTRWLGRKEMGVRILCYHHVNDTEKNYTTVPVQNFRAQMRFLSEEGYQTISLDVIASGQRERSNDDNVGNRCSKTIVITFDDGYQDNYTNAFPIMKELGFKGIVFCVANKIGSTGYLGEKEIKEMAQSGFEFGSHTVSHRDLPSLVSEDKWREINDSKSLLSKELDLDIDFFCYPRGLYDTESLKLVDKAGYLAACSNAPGSNDPNKNGKGFNPFLLKRTEIAPHDSLEDFEKKLAGAYDWMHAALHLLRGQP